MKELLKRPLLRLLCLLGLIVGPFFKKDFDKSKVKKILVFQLGGIGDVLLTFPALESLLNKFPDGTISVITEFGDDVFALFPNPSVISRKYRYDPKGIHKKIFKKIIFFRSLKHEGFDLMYNFNRGNSLIEGSIMALLTGVPHRIGFEYKGAGSLNTIRTTLKLDKYILEQNLDLLRISGINCDKSRIHLSVPTGAQEFAVVFLRNNNITCSDFIITVHPGARHHKDFKMWPKEKFCRLIKEVISGYTARVILIGEKAESPDAYQILQEVNNPNLINAVGKTTIIQMAALIKESNLFIGNDSAPLHIAIAQDVPSVGIFTATSPAQLVPLHEEHISIVTASSDPAYLHQPLFKLNQHNKNSVYEISVDQVMTIVHEKLKQYSRSQETR